MTTLAMLPIVVLRLVDRARWAARIRAAVRASRGDLCIAAQKLGCGRTTLYRWLAAADFARDRLPRRPVGAPSKKRGNVAGNART